MSKSIPLDFESSQTLRAIATRRYPATRLQRMFARFTLLARRQRVRGRIALAMHWERQADKAYDQLPSKLLW